MRDAILEKLREIEDMFAAATCDSRPVAECETVEWELKTAMDALVQEALGACDVCYETHNRIQDLVTDLEADIAELEAE